MFGSQHARHHWHCQQEDEQYVVWPPCGLVKPFECLREDDERGDADEQPAKPTPRKRMQWSRNQPTSHKHQARHERKQPDSGGRGDNEAKADGALGGGWREVIGCIG